jgi:hypothetical protein
MKKHLLIFFVLLSGIFNAQNWTKLAGGEGYQGYTNSSGGGPYGHSEVLNQYSPKNLPYFYSYQNAYGYLSDNARWNVNDEFIYVFENNSGNINFWLFDTNIKQWKKLNATSTENYGTKGVASPSNFPGPRIGTVTWVDNDGNLWMYGNAWWPKQSDMWKYDRTTGMWTWMSGTESDSSSLPAQQGVASATALPKTYNNAYSWVDSQNNLWLFGGDRQNTSSSSSNQVWKYSTSTGLWTWMKGNSDVDNQDAGPVLGTENVEAAANSPGEKYMFKGALWQANNYVYILAGDDRPVMWRYNMQTNNWAHVKKTATATTYYDYGLQGVENASNFPPTVENPTYWKDDSGNFWMFGGQIRDNNSNYTGSVGRRAWVNTLWKYNPTSNNWTWMRGKNPLTYTVNVNSINPIPFSPGYYGLKDVTSDLNLPASRNRPVFWKKNSELFFGYGESTLNLSSNPLKFTDLWKYDISSNNFTWIGGRTAASNNLEYIEDLVNPSVYNVPLVKNYIFDGLHTVYAFRQSQPNEIWAFDMVQSTWQRVKAGQPANYGTIGVESPTNAPYQTQNTWIKDGHLYILSTEIAGTPYALWKFDVTTKNYTCLKMGSYTPGNIDLPNSSNFPEANYEAANWVNDNKLYTLGGGDSDNSSTDFWEYDFASNMWVRRNGLPTKLHSMSYAKDSGKNLWIFGGSYDTDASYQESKKNNNVWKYDYVTKVWQQLQGGPVNATGHYGAQNISTQSTRPGSRTPVAYWMDEYDRFWIYSGQGYAEVPVSNYYDRFLNDLWYYDTNLNRWFWVSGVNTNITQNEYSNGYYDNSRYIYSAHRYDNMIYPFVYNNKKHIFAAKSAYSDNINGLWQMDINSVPAYNFISGTATFDIDSNSCSTADPKYKSLKIMAQNGANSAVSYTDHAGNYQATLNQLSGATLSAMPEMPSYFSVTPSAANVIFPPGSNTAVQDFCITPSGVHNDLEIKIIPLTQSRPGFESKYKIVYFNKGTTTLSGSIQFQFPNNYVSYFNYTVAPSNNANGVMTWDFTALAPFQQKEITVGLNLNTPMHTTYPLNGGQVITVNGAVTPTTGDGTPADNSFVLNDTLVNSLDPNDKVCLEGSTIAPEMVGEYLHYLIRFENTGTANAINVVLKDVLDTSKLDIASLQPISASHPYHVNITDGNKLEVVFNGIQLPYPPSYQRYGYFLFKIKTKSTVALGDVIQNKADIFFDYNYPIITNEYQTTVAQNLSTQEVQQSKIGLYPNPVDSYLFIQIKERIKSVGIYDTAGRLVATFINPGNRIDLSNLKTGSYVIKITTETANYQNKIIKK